MGAMLDAFKLITWSYAFVPLVFLLRRSATRVGAPTAAME